ncbi:MAG: hypothetical protein ACLFV4_09430 [Candidatus Hydrogenedentota bacterium]
MHIQTECWRAGLNPLQRTFAGVLALAITVSLGSLAGGAELEDEDVDWEYVEPSTEFDFRVERFEANPIIHREMHGLIGDRGANINGPSLIRVPDWVEDPLGEYYLYFAHHNGSYIRLAYADALEGPWKIHEPGVLDLEETPGRGHVASPDVHVDRDEQRIRMYHHAPNPTDGPEGQGAYVALSEDGLEFEALDEYLGLFYFRVFERDGWHYALAKYFNDGGILYRSPDGLTDFEEGPRILPRVRHKALWEHDDKLYVFFSRGGDTPEHIMVSRIENLDDDWEEWRFTEPQTVLKPEKDYEGADEPIETSSFGSTYDFVHQLRDPAIHEEDGRLYMLYSTAGERAIAIAELHFEEE